MHLGRLLVISTPRLGRGWAVAGLSAGSSRVARRIGVTILSALERSSCFCFFEMWDSLWRLLLLLFFFLFFFLFFLQRAHMYMCVHAKICASLWHLLISMWLQVCIHLRTSCSCSGELCLHQTRIQTTKRRKRTRRKKKRERKSANESQN